MERERRASVLLAARRGLGLLGEELARHRLLAWVELARSRVDAFMRLAAGRIAPDARVLDAGAGRRPYRRYFAHTRYESTDIEDAADDAGKPLHDFVCSLDAIPKEDATYDAILNTQVLEHVPDPGAVVKEFFRVLKPGGRLFLTAPQGWGIHLAPHHYFNFTRYGLELLFRRAGFQVELLRASGGYFRYVGYLVQWLPHRVYFQYLPGAGGGGHWERIGRGLVALLGLPFYLAAVPVCNVVIPILALALDGLDRRREFTLGYECICTKPGLEAMR